MDLPIIAGLAVLCITIYGVVQSSGNIDKIEQEKRETKLGQLKAIYDLVLRSYDKADAPQKGRVYYSLLREGTLTVYDEQAMSNDLNAMS